MISRRALLGTGGGVVALAGAAIYADRVHKLDDFADRIGLDPQPMPADSDDALIRTVQHDQSVLLLTTRSVASRHAGLARTLAPLAAIAGAQLADLGGVVADVDIAAPASTPSAALDAVTAAHRRAAAERAAESLEAVSGDFAQVLAAISASLSQSVVVLRNARKALP